MRSEGILYIMIHWGIWRYKQFDQIIIKDIPTVNFLWFLKLTPRLRQVTATVNNMYITNIK